MSKRKIPVGEKTHGSIQRNGTCCICFTKTAKKLFKCKQLCCSSCMENWIYTQRGELKGTARDTTCFSGCGNMLSLEDLRELLSKQSFDKYCSDLTRVTLNAEKNTVWCACGTIFQAECGRNLVPYWHRCQGCKNYVCLGCGEFSNVPSSRRARRKTTTKRRNHKKLRHCEEAKHGQSNRCPKCSTEIQRVAGCADMRCVICNHRFIWRV